jgi:hypothetical protein
MLALLASMRARGDSIAWFRICPVIAAVRLPQEAERLASSMYWYRRYDGGYWQELRLMPSNVRVYFQSPVAFGTDTEVAFSMFGLSSRQRCESFLENLCGSSLAALTLYARTLRDDGRGGYLGLELNDVWMDKDAVVAADGALHFADLEGLEDVRSASREEARQRMRWQCFRHIYEVSFALEAAAREADRFLALGQDRQERRGWLMDLMRRGTRMDGYVQADLRRGGLWLAVRPAVGDGELAVDLEIFSEVSE